MTGSANNRLVYGLAGLLIIALAVLVYQYRAIEALEQRVIDNEGAITARTQQAASARERAESQAARIKVLETTPDPVTGMIRTPTALMIATLQPGFYELSTETPYDPARIREAVGFLLGYPQFQEQ